MSTLSVREYGPSPLRDANQLHSACNCGRNGDAGQIISILAHRSAAQRFQIRQAYDNFFDEDIIQLFEDVLSGAFKEAVLLWVLGPAERDAQLAYDSMMFGGPALIEIACTRSSDEIFEVRKAYHALFKNSLEEHVSVCVEREFGKLLVPLLTAYRCEDAEVEYTVVEEEARLLHEKIGSHSYANEEIIRILTTRSKAQLKATFNAYHKEFGHPINKDLKSDQDDEFLSMLRAITKCITCPEKYFEKTIRLAINMMESDRETSDRKTITRVIATRAKIDLKLIKELYFKRNGVPLVHAINKYTTGDYEDFLVAIVGEENA